MADLGAHKSNITLAFDWQGPFKGRSYPNSTMIGIGLTPEGTLQNDVIYEFMMEHLWRTEPANLTEWSVLGLINTLHSFARLTVNGSENIFV